MGKSMEDFNTKCYVINIEENKSKEIQGKNVLSFTKFVLGGFCLGGFVLGVFVRGYMSGVFCPDTVKNTGLDLCP